jgi:CO/xanthine dehydrogenase Mo-binding subunit
MTLAERAALARIDGVDKVTGGATYAADVTRPGMLWGKVLRSPVAHARILSIDAGRAREVPGVHAVLTARDIPEYRIGRSMRDMPVLARNRVRFFGEKVAAVAAESPEIAEEALGLIEVEYEELPAVYDPVEAMQPGAPLIHDPETVRAWATPAQKVADYPNSVNLSISGASPEEMERAFAAADHVFEHTYRTPIQHQGYLEPHACLVELNDQGVAEIWASNKAPFLLLNYLREGLGLTRDQLDIQMMPVGGCFGGKGSFMDIPLAHQLALVTSRPVKMVMTYTEELMAGNPRHAAVVTVRSGFNRDGRLVARWSRVVFASGAYAAFKPSPDASISAGAHAGGVGPYDVPVARVEVHMVYTNTVPGGHMRMPGETQPLYAEECHMDLCARAMGIDPLQLRLINAKTKPRETPISAPGSLPRAREALREAARAIGWDQPKPDGVGRGMAMVEIATSPIGVYTAELIVGRDGQLTLHTPIIEQGCGMLTVFRQLVAEAWQVPLEQVRVVQTMAGIEFDRGVGGSRVTRVVGRVISMLTERLQKRLAELLANELGEEDPSRIALEPGGFRTRDGRVHTLAEVVALAGTDLKELVRHEPGPDLDLVEVYAVQAAEVEVDRETGQVKVRRVVTAHETGRILNPMLHQGQIDGNIIQGMGYALTEGLNYEDGRVTNLNLHEYKMPSIVDLPPLETILLPEDRSIGTAAIGEGPHAGISPALINAIVDVVGPHQIDIPITPDVVRQLANQPRS